MALILAIEPDRRQASHLTAMVRGRLHAEFVIGDSAERALAALGDRVPDLVLTTALLSPKDETELTDRLRALDGAAAHVQTLTIPVLASPNARRSVKSGGMLSALLGDKGDDGPVDGCDPAFFAEQCKEYLQRAATERAAVKEDELERFDTTPAPSPVAASAPIDALNEFAPVVMPKAEVEVPEAVPVVLTPAAPIAAPPSVSIRDLYIRADDEEAPSSLMAAVAALAEEEPAIEETEAEAEPFIATAMNEEEASHQESHDDSFSDFDLSAMLDDPSRAKTAVQAPADDEEPAVNVYEIDSSILADGAGSADEPAATVSEVQLYTPLARPEARTWPILEGLATGGAAENGDASEAASAAVAEHREPNDHELVEWSDILEALRRDAQPVAFERERPAPSEPSEIDNAQLPSMMAEAPTSPEPALAEPAPAEPVTPDSSASENGTGRRKRARKGASVEDEWGFFDPDRAGFAALLAKLEEITEDDSAKSQRT